MDRFEVHLVVPLAVVVHKVGIQDLGESSPVEDHLDHLDQTRMDCSMVGIVDSAGESLVEAAVRDSEEDPARM